MNDKEKFRLLKNFFGAYFNQDWRRDAERWEDVVVEYSADTTKEQRIKLSSAILEYSTKFADDIELEKELMREFDCYYSPSAEGQSAKEWLRTIARSLT